MKKKFILLLLLFYGCRETTNEGYKENIVVSSFLCPNVDKQAIYVDRTYRLDETIDTTGVSGATCELWDSTGIVVSFKQGVVKGTYFSPTGWRLKPKTFYSLEVRYEDYVVKASTTVPDTFSIISPGDGDTIYLSSPPSYFLWTSGEGAAIYNIWLLAEGDTVLPFLSLATCSTKLSIPPGFANYFDSTGWYIIKVVAKDTNYYERGNRASLVDSLDGGLGFVGSLSFDSARVYIQQ